MNNQVRIIEDLHKLQPHFDTQNNFNLKFEAECLFAKQQLVKNDFTVSTAQNNPNSLRSAILNVAAIGISLNPATAHAYLVPRTGAICLDISYRGLVKLATDAGAIKWAKAELVYEGDTFLWKGPTELPTHEFDPFDPERMDIKKPLERLRGGYCIAKLTTGDYMIDRMTAAEILKVAQTSKASNGPWKTWPEEMAKKTLVKRACKSWPQSNGRSRVDEAVAILNEHEGLEEIKSSGVADRLIPSLGQTEKYLQLAEGDPIDFSLWFYGLDQRIQAGLPNIQFDPGTKGATMKVYNAALSEGREQFETMKIAIVADCANGDEAGIVETLENLPANQRAALLDGLNMEQLSFINSIEG